MVHANEDLVISDGIGLALPVGHMQQGDTRFPDQLILPANCQKQGAAVPTPAPFRTAVPRCMEQYVPGLTRRDVPLIEFLRLGVAARVGDCPLELRTRRR